jgi:NADH-quinone oxidoreductase subunit L
MWNDSSFSKFLAYLTTFTFFMSLMVTSGNMVQLFIGWEGIGLASFLLINF